MSACVLTRLKFVHVYKHAPRFYLAFSASYHPLISFTFSMSILQQKQEPPMLNQLPELLICPLAAPSFRHSSMRRMPQERLPSDLQLDVAFRCCLHSACFFSFCTRRSNIPPCLWLGTACTAPPRPPQPHLSLISISVATVFMYFAPQFFSCL